MTEITNCERLAYQNKIDELVKQASDAITKNHTKNAVFKYRAQVRKAIEDGTLTLRPEEDFKGGQAFSGKAGICDEIYTYFRVNKHDFEPRVDKAAIKKDLDKFKEDAHTLKMQLTVKSKEDFVPLYDAFSKKVKAL